MTHAMFDPYAALARIRAGDGGLSQVSHAFAAGSDNAKSLPHNETTPTFAGFATFAETPPRNHDPAPARRRNTEWTADDWREHFEKRVAVAMIDGERPEAAARRFVYECCIVRWLDLHPVTSAPDAGCIACGKPDLPGDALTPFGIDPPGAAWLHSRCWQAWRDGRHSEAAAALSTAGITPSIEGSA